MHIKEVKISNLLSFPYLKNFEEAEKVSFFSEQKYDGMRILIWNNASGKSNFTQIIEEFFSTLVKDYSFNDNAEGNKQRKTITARENKTKNLHTHYQFPDKKSEIEIMIELGEHDYENIGFVCKYWAKINEMLDKYSKLNINFPSYKLTQIQASTSTIKLKATFDEKKQEFSREIEHLNEIQRFILQCLQEYNLLQILIHLFNTKEKKIEERRRYFLKKTFGIINIQRDNLTFNSFLAPKELINDLHCSRNSLTGYTNCVNKIWGFLENFAQKQVINIKNWEKIELKNSDFFISLNYIIEKFLSKKLNIEYINKTIHLSLVDKNQRIVYFNELSSGEKSILTIIFALYGNDLKEGFILINEPELHLHPQIQKELARTLEQISENIKAQVFLSTNSPLFINEDNITNVYRVYKQEDQSKIISPKIYVDYDDATLIHMLKFENLSKIFFVNKIILVEGDTDAYFFSYYVNYLKTLQKRKSKISDYEIININGKWSLHTRKKFLNKFNIENAFIWDRDNTVDYWFFSKGELNRYYQLANQNYRENHKNKRYDDYYNRLVKTILTFSPKKHKAIIRGIEKLYEENVFILKEGAIETYVRVEKKGLGQMAQFCNNHFQERLHDPSFKTQRKELEEIMEAIFAK